MAGLGKGTVASVSSTFPAEEARKAAQRMQGKFYGRHKELDILNSLVDDNTNLINQVQRLPDELHHNIMVLLGDGYFSEERPNSLLKSLKEEGRHWSLKLDSLKSVIEYLKTEASFFDRMAVEAAKLEKSLQMMNVLENVYRTSAPFL